MLLAAPPAKSKGDVEAVGVGLEGAFCFHKDFGLRGHPKGNCLRESSLPPEDWTSLTHTSSQFLFTTTKAGIDWCVWGAGCYKSSSLRNPGKRDAT